MKQERHATIYGVIDTGRCEATGVMATRNPVEQVILYTDENGIEYLERHHSLEMHEHAQDFFKKYKFPPEQHFGTVFKLNGYDAIYFMVDCPIPEAIDLRLYNKVVPVITEYDECCTGDGSAEGGWSTYGMTRTMPTFKGDFEEEELYRGQNESDAPTYYC